MFRVQLIATAVLAVIVAPPPFSDACFHHSRPMRLPALDRFGGAIDYSNAPSFQDLLRDHYNRSSSRDLMMSFEQQQNDSSTTGQLCGTPEISEEERVELGKAYEDWFDAHHEETVTGHRLRRNLCELVYKVRVHFVVFVHQDDSVTGSPSVTHPERLTTTMRNDLLDTLNHGYRNSPFLFEFGSVRHIVNSTWAECTDPNTFRTLFWHPVSDQLTIYFCNVYRKGNVGFASLPFQTRHNPQHDFVEIMSPGMRNNAEADVRLIQQVLIHEVGHWLGLLHTFSGGCDGTERWQRRVGDQLYYFFAGDGVADTASQESETWDYPDTTRTCYLETSTNESLLDTCDDSIMGTDPGTDAVTNYMNYIQTHCFEQHGQFTPMQVERMVAEFETFRLVTNIPTCRPSSMPSITSAPTRAPTPKPTKLCMGIKKACRSTSQCCGALSCIKKRLQTGNLAVSGSCLGCRKMSVLCTQHSDCCSRKCLHLNANRKRNMKQAKKARCT